MFDSYHSGYGAQDKYNPKVHQRKLEMESEWAQVLKHQQAVHEKLLQEELQQKKQTKNEMSNVLSHMVNEKEMKKKARV